ncbi:MAG: hypothetical protein SGARI_003053, partial [Bacillariaceae sp.]
MEVETVLNTQLKITRQELDSLNARMRNGGDPDGSMSHRIQDVRAKHVALKIYLGCIYEIEKAVTLKVSLKINAFAFPAVFVEHTHARFVH